MAAPGASLRGEAYRTARAAPFPRRSSRFLPLQFDQQPLLGPLVVHAGRADGNADDARRLLDGQVVVEDELDHLALPASEAAEGAEKGGRALGLDQAALRGGR